MAAVKFSAAEIARLIAELKHLGSRWERRLLTLRFKNQVSQKRSGLVVQGETGEFEIKVRQSADYPLDFSVIVGFRKKNENNWFHLKRYNGRHPGPHVNRRPGKPKEEIAGFHIHIATEEAQRRGRDEEADAIETTAYTDVLTAIDFALSDCNFVKPAVKRDDDPNQYQLWNNE